MDVIARLDRDRASRRGSSSRRSSYRFDMPLDNLKNLQSMFKENLRGKEEMNLDDFRKMIVSKNSLFAERAFHIFDHDGSGTISMKEFVTSVHRFAGQTPDDKLQFLFRIYDLDGDGQIQFNELTHVLKACMEENGMQFTDEQIEDLSALLFEDANVDENDAISFEQLKQQLQRRDGMLENLSISMDRWLLPLNKQKIPWWKELWERKPYHLSWSYVRNNISFLIFFFIYIAINVILFATRAHQYRHVNGWTMVARGCGQCLNFTCSMILVFMLRHLLTFARDHGLGSILPIDQSIYFHKVTGIMIFFYGLVHTICHLFNFGLNVKDSPALGKVAKGHYTYGEWLFTMKPGLFGLIPGIANVTGVVLMLILIVMVVLSMPSIRRSGLFEVFYWSHFLYIPFWILCILHGPVFWEWFIGPLVLYVFELIGRVGPMRSGLGRTYLKCGVCLPSRVTQLVITRPSYMHFNAGDYVFIKIPGIAKYEWHPFTISSAPEQLDTLTLHIRTLGGWTKRLYEYFEEEQRQLEHKMKLKQKQQEDLSRKQRRQSRRQSMAVCLSVPASYNKEILHRRKSSLKRLQKAIQRRLQDSDSEPDLESGSHKAGHDNPVFTPEIQVEGVSLKKIEEENDKRVAYSPKPTNDTSSSDIGFTALHTAMMSTDNEPLEVYLDGPYGTPSSHIFHAEHAVLIATGIGVTPFASILQSIMIRYKRSQLACPSCNYIWAGDIPASVMKLRKVDFFWINRDQRCFEWFVDLLSQLEIEQAELGTVMERFLDMHMYITSALQKNDMKAIGLQLALDLMHEKKNRDLITGLKTRTNNGRPNWNKVFQKIHDERRGRVTVFYCGPPTLARTLRSKCVQYGFRFKKEVF